MPVPTPPRGCGRRRDRLRRSRRGARARTPCRTRGRRQAPSAHRPSVTVSLSSSVRSPSSVLVLLAFRAVQRRRLLVRFSPLRGSRDGRWQLALRLQRLLRSATFLDSVPMNCRALFSQECVERKCAACLARQRSAPRQASRRSSLSTPIGLLPMTSFGPVTGKAATGTPQASASSCTTPNVSVLLGNTKTSAAARWPASVSPSSGRGTWRRESAAAAQPPAVRAPMTTLVPGRSSERNASRFFSTAIRPTLTKIGRGRSRVDRALGREEVGVDAARPHAEIIEAALRQFRHQRGRRHHRDGGGARGSAAARRSSSARGSGSAP